MRVTSVTALSLFVAFNNIKAQHSDNSYVIESSRVESYSADQQLSYDVLTVDGTLYLDYDSRLDVKTLRGNGNIYARHLTQLFVTDGLLDFQGVIHITSPSQELYDRPVGNLIMESGALVVSGNMYVASNLTISESAEIIFNESSNLSVGNDVAIYCDLSLSNAELSFGGNISLGGNVFIASDSKVTPSNENYTVSFCGSRNSAIHIQGEFPIVNVSVAKSDDADVLICDGELNLSGNLIGVSGSITGTARFIAGNGLSNISQLDDNVFKSLDIILDKPFSYKKPSLVALSSIYVNSVFSGRLNDFYIGAYELSVNKCINDDNYCHIVTDGKAADRGVRMPLVEGNRVRFSLYRDGITLSDGEPLFGDESVSSVFTVNFTDEGNMVSLAPNVGYHYAVHYVDMTKTARMYYRISTDRPSIVSTEQETYTILPFDGPKEFYPVVYDGSEWFVQPDSQSSLIVFRGITKGEFTCSKTVEAERRTFISSSSGSFDRNIWKIKGDNSSTLYPGTDIGYDDNVIIKSGHTIKSTPLITKNYFYKFKPVHLLIESGATLVMNRKDIMLDIVHFINSSVEGDGTIEFYNDATSPNKTWTRYWDVSRFMQSKNSLFIYANTSSSNPEITQFFNTSYLGNIVLRGNPFKIGCVNADLFQGDVSIETTVQVANSHLAFAKNVTVNENHTLHFSVPGVYEIKGDLVNNGTILCCENAVLYVHGNVINNGSMVVDGELTFAGDNKLSRLYGSSRDISIHSISVNKRNPICEVRVELPVSLPVLNVKPLCGSLHFVYDDDIESAFSLSDAVDGTLWLSNKNTVLVSDCLNGCLRMDNEAVVSVNHGTNGALKYGPYAQIRISDNATLRAVDLSPFDLWCASMPWIDLSVNANLCLSEKLDIRGGSLSMRDNAKINFLCPQESSPKIYFSANMETLSKTSSIIVSSAELVKLQTHTPWGNLHIVNGTTIELYGESLKLQGDIYLEENATLDVSFNKYDVSLAGDVTLYGDYLHRGNETSLVGDYQMVDIANGELSSLLCCGNVLLSNDLTVRGRTLNTEPASHILGKSLIVSGDERQICNIEGQIDCLEIDNPDGLLCERLLRSPMVIGRRLNLSNGVWDIGGNTLELKPDAAISGSGRIALSSTTWNSGLKYHINAEERNTISFPLMINGNYMPVSLDNVVSSTTGSVTLKIDERQESGRIDSYLQLFSSDICIKEGYMLCDLVCPSHLPADYDPVIKTVNQNWTRTSGSVISDNSILHARYSLPASPDGYYSVGKSSSSIYRFESKHDMTDLRTFSPSDWIITDSNGTLVDAESISSFNNGILIVKHNIHFSDNYFNNLNLNAVEIQKGAVLDLDHCKGVNLGVVSGQGTLKVQSNEALPKGDFSRFCSFLGGVVEYGGNDDYEMLPMSSHMNNVVISGDGSRILRCADTFIDGSLTISNANLYLSVDSRLYLNRDLCVNGGEVTGDGSLFLSGRGVQLIRTTDEFVCISNLGINNPTGVTAVSDLSLSRLDLLEGVLDMSDNVLRVADGVSVLGKSSYVSGKMQMALPADEESYFPVGDAGRLGFLGVVPDNDAVWQVEYHNAPHPDRTDNMATEYWVVQSLAQPDDRCRIIIRYDAPSAYRDRVVASSPDNNHWAQIYAELHSGYNNYGTMLSERVKGTPTVYSWQRRSPESVCIWTGLKNSDWTDVYNWLDNTIPSSESDVRIPSVIQGAYWPVIDAQYAEAHNIQIDENAELSLIGSDAKLMVSNNVVNQGSLNLYYKYTQIPVFSYGGRILGNKPCIYRTFVRNRGYYIGSATEEGTFENLLSLNSGNGDMLRQYDTRSGSFHNVSFLDGESLSQKAGSFFMSKVQHSSNGHNDNYIIQRGSPSRNGIQITGQLSKGWHWLANPFPFAVSVKNFVSPLYGRIAPSIYARGHRSLNGTGGYLFYTYNMDEDLSAAGNDDESLDTLAPFEGFAVYCESDGTVLMLHPQMAADSQKPSLKSTLASSDNITLRLTVGVDFRKDELLLLFRNGGSTKKHKSDSYKIESQPRASYQIYTSKDSSRISIALYPPLDKLPDSIVSFSVMPTDGDTTLPVISVKGISSIDQQYTVFLKDNLTGAVSDLRLSPSYHIPEADKLYLNRFSLIFGQKQEPSPTALPGRKADQSNSPTLSPAQSDTPPITYDIIGRKHLRPHKGITIHKNKAKQLLRP